MRLALISLLAACGAPVDTCRALARAARACPAIADSDECAAHLRMDACSAAHVAAWADYLDCAAEECDAGGAPDPCAPLLEGISWSCTPWGPAGG